MIFWEAQGTNDVLYNENRGLAVNYEHDDHECDAYNFYMDGNDPERDHNGWYTQNCWNPNNWDPTDDNYRNFYWTQNELQITLRVDIVDVVYDVGEFWPKQAYPGLACRVDDDRSFYDDTFALYDFYLHSYIDDWYHQCETRNVDSSMSYLTAGLAALMASTSFF